MIIEVAEYIDVNVLHSKVWDEANEKIRTKAVNNSKRLLMQMLPNHYQDAEAIPIDHIAEQSIWMLKLDDSIQRAELGLSYFQIDGVAMNITDKDRSIAPYIYKAFNLPKTYFEKRRVVPYANPHHPTHSGVGRFRC